MRILVAGDRGYIGAVMTPYLRQAGHTADGLDLGLYEGCDFAGGPAEGLSQFRDTRDVSAADLDGYDAVVCLAALSNDPLGELSAATTYSINVDGTIALAQAAKDAGVPRFIFASSCSLYGAAGSGAVAEDADMRPVTPYGESKVMAEKRLSAMADDNFHPTYMRNATAYGASPRLRLDIVVNNLTGIAVTTGRVRLQSDGTPWRPLVHIADISRATQALVEAPIEVIHDEAFNIGRDEDNLQIRDIAEMVATTAAGSVVTYAPDAGPDLRNYRADFSKLHDTFPDLGLQWTVADGVRELVSAYTEHGLTLGEFDSSRFVRLRRVQELMAAGQVDDSLRRVVVLEQPTSTDRLIESVGA
jgi:nucleoside-diphosphate-sugar epimerase